MRIAVALSGGRNSAALLCLANALRDDVVALHATLKTHAPTAYRNAVMLSRALNVPLFRVYVPWHELLDAYRKGFRELQEGSTPWQSVCRRCTAVMHRHLVTTACELGADELWFGYTQTQCTVMGIGQCPQGTKPKICWPFVQWPELRDLYIGLLGQVVRATWSPLRTNCRLNWLIIDECLRMGRANPYLPYFQAHARTQIARWGWWALATLTKLALRLGFKRRLIRGLRDEIISDDGR